MSKSLGSRGDLVTNQHPSDRLGPGRQLLGRHCGTCFGTVGLDSASRVCIEPSPDGHLQHRPSGHADRRDPYRESVALRWNTALLTAVRAVRFAPMLTARALAIVHTCTYDAWAAYDARAEGTVFGDTAAATARAHAWCQGGRGQLCRLSGARRPVPVAANGVRTPDDGDAPGSGRRIDRSPRRRPVWAMLRAVRCSPGGLTMAQISSVT